MSIEERLKEAYKAYEATGDQNSKIAQLLKEAASELKMCRNELCLRCGQYKQRYLGACDGCRWYELPKEET